MLTLKKKWNDLRLEMEGVQKIDGGRIGAHRWRAVYVHFVCGNSWQFRRSILVVDSFSRIRFPIINKNLINLRSMHRVSWQVPDLITPKQRSPDKTPVDRASCMGRMRFPPPSPLLEFIYLFIISYSSFEFDIRDSSWAFLLIFHLEEMGDIVHW